MSGAVLIFSAVAPGKCIENSTCTFGRGTCIPIWLNATYGTYNCTCKSQFKGANCEHGNTLTCVDIHCSLPAQTMSLSMLGCRQFHRFMWLPHAVIVTFKMHSLGFELPRCESGHNVIKSKGQAGLEAKILSSNSKNCPRHVLELFILASSWKWVWWWTGDHCEFVMIIYQSYLLTYLVLLI